MGSNQSKSFGNLIFRSIGIESYKTQLAGQKVRQSNFENTSSQLKLDFELEFNWID